MRLIGPVASPRGMSDHSLVPVISRLVRSAAAVAVTLLVTLAVSLLQVPASVAAAPAAATPAPAHLELHGDTVAPAANARTGSHTWRGSRISYYETVPAKWDWSLSMAVAKWNSTGATVRFVRTPYRSRADLTIGYGDTRGSAGLATVGRTAHAWVHLSTAYAAADGNDAHNRVEVLGIFAHELGHVLGFGHTSASCSLMSPVLDVSGCGVVTDATPGYYRCRTLDDALVARFVRIYGGRTRYIATTWCLIDPLPSALSVAFHGEQSGSVRVSWARPTYLPAGSRVQIQHWVGDTCQAPPVWSATDYSDPTAAAWSDARPEDAYDNCFEARLVNRYGVGRASVGARLARTAATQAQVPAPDPTDPSADPSDGPTAGPTDAPTDGATPPVTGS